MSLIPASMALKFARQGLVLQKHAPSILFVGGVVGTVASTVLACKATLKVEAVLTEAQEYLEMTNSVQDNPAYTEEDRRKDKVMIYTKASVGLAKLYAPSVFLGLLSIAALTKSHNLLSARNAALTAAYAALERGFGEYRRRVAEEIGEDKEREIYYPRVEVEEADDDGKIQTISVVDPNQFSPYARFFDELCQDWSRKPEHNQMFLRAQQNYMNDLLRSRGHVFLNEVYDSIGLPRTKEGAVVGWYLHKGGDNFVDFGIFDKDSESARDFVNGREKSILLDFNVDGVIFDKLDS